MSVKSKDVTAITVKAALDAARRAGAVMDDARLKADAELDRFAATTAGIMGADEAANALLALGVRTFTRHHGEAATKAMLISMAERLDEKGKPCPTR